MIALASVRLTVSLELGGTVRSSFRAADGYIITAGDGMIWVNHGSQTVGTSTANIQECTKAPEPAYDAQARTWIDRQSVQKRR